MSDSTKTKYVNSGTGFLGFLTLLFIHHKLIGTITWSWWWVLSPLWLVIAVAIIAFLVAAAIAYYLTKR
jgi:uncharacterized protein (DUF983 family)